MDSNLVIREAAVDRVLWASHTYFPNPPKCVKQTDGNLVIYVTPYRAVWATNTNGNPRAHVTLQNDGNLVISEPNYILWESGSGQVQGPPPGQFGFAIYQTCQSGQRPYGGSGLASFPTWTQAESAAKARTDSLNKTTEMGAVIRTASLESAKINAKADRFA